MKITHFNGFDEDNSFRRQLKQKMQNFEPEVSNTLWDRIELNLNNQQEKKSKKGLWMLVWFLSIGFTALLTWGVYDYTSVNEDAKNSVQNETPLYVNSEITKETPLANPDHIESTSTDFLVSDRNTPDNLIANNYTPKKSNYYIGKPGNNDVKNNANPNTGNNGLNNSETSPTGNDTKNNDLKTPEKPIETGTLPLAKITEPTSSLLKNNDSDKTAKPTNPDETKNTITNKKTNKKKLNLERLSIAFYQVAAYNYRTIKTVEGSSPVPEMPREDDRNNYDKGAITYNNISLNLQYKIAEHWYISAGYGSYNFQNDVKFDSLRKDISFIGAKAWYGNEKDSVAIGNGKVYQSTWNIQQIPVEITYKNKINRRFSYVVGTGIEYNIVKNYMYRMFDAKFRNDFIPIEKGNNYDQLFPDAGFKNYFSVQLRAGVDYQIFDRWSIRLNAYGSKAIQSYSKKESGLDTRPYRLGLQTGLIFHLK